MLPYLFFSLDIVCHIHYNVVMETRRHGMKKVIAAFVAGAVLTAGINMVPSYEDPEILLAQSLSDRQFNEPKRNSKGKDGYKFAEPQYEIKKGTYEVVTHDSYESMRKVLVAEAAKTGAKVGFSDEADAFSLLYPKENRCVIHMIDPGFRYMPEIVGHEFMHCIYGQFHTSNMQRR
jgi:hypothetical protein